MDGVILHVYANITVLYMQNPWRCFSAHVKCAFSFSLMNLCVLQISKRFSRAIESDASQSDSFVVLVVLL